MAAIRPPSELRIIDVHTHSSGADVDGSPEEVVRCLDESGVEMAFVFAPMLDVHGWNLTDEHIHDIRLHNDYIAHFCCYAPERLLAFAVLNPNPGLARGDPERAVELMVEEARRCYHELGIRGVKMVPDRWRVNDHQLLPLLRTLAELGMYAALHCGIFLDERASDYCRPASYEAVHSVPGFHGHLAHLCWPWVDECIAVLGMEGFHAGRRKSDPWQLKVDLSFGCPTDWQLESVRKALDYLPHDMVMYASDVFWPCDSNRYLEEYVYPQWSNFEAAASISRDAPAPGSQERSRLRHAIFHDNALQHWQVATRGKPQQLLRQARVPDTRHAFPRPNEEAQRGRSPAAGKTQRAGA